MQGWSSVLLIGHSYGAPLVCELAVLHPKRIAGVVCLGFGYPRQVMAITLLSPAHLKSPLSDMHVSGDVCTLKQLQFTMVFCSHPLASRSAYWS